MKFLKCKLYKMNIRRTLTALFSATALFAAAQQINPITQAALDSYQEILNDNPKDYITYYQRAMQYYSLSMYDKALSDVQNAIKYTPSKDKDQLLQDYTLLSSIYTERKEYSDAMVAVDKALELDPRSYSLLYAKGNLCLYLNRPQDARVCFSAMQSIKSRSQEALFGLAKSAIMLDNRGEAKTLMEEAERLDSSNYLTYCRLGDLALDLGDNQLAAAHYLSAFALGQTESRPMESLIRLAEKDYGSVESALNFAISKTDNTLPLNFMKGNIALNSGNYESAYQAFKELLKNPDARIGSVYASLATACLALDRMDEALEAANNAVAADASVASYLTKARVSRAMGNPATAIVAATKAYEQDINSVPALTEMALDNIALGNTDEAMKQLNEAILTDPTDAYAIMVRAYLNSDVKNDMRAALADYQRVTTLPLVSFPGVAYKALATTLAGDKNKGDLIMAQAMKEASAPSDYYYAAIYYARSGALDKGKEMIDKALELGYNNLYNLNKEKTANLDIAPIRHLR